MCRIGSVTRSYGWTRKSGRKLVIFISRRKFKEGELNRVSAAKVLLWDTFQLRTEFGENVAQIHAPINLE